MPLIKLDQKIRPGQKLQVGNLQILWAIIGPVVLSPRRTHLPHIHGYKEYAGMEVESWTYKTGPIRKIELVNEDGQRTLWVGWR